MTRAAVVTTLFLVLLELLGARHFVGVLSGTLTDGGRAGAFLGLLYTLTFLAVVVLVPVLLLADGLLHLLARARRRST